MIEIHGNTYQHRERLKAMGGKWSASRKCWLVPDNRADEARALVGSPAANSGRSRRTCATCGQRINYGVYCGKCEFSR